MITRRHFLKLTAGLGAVDIAEKAAGEKSIQLREDEKAQFEQRIIQAKPWNEGRKYVAGWSEGRDVTLLYRDADSQRQLEKITGMPWYFFMRTDDALRVPLDLWDRWGRIGVFERLEADDVNPDWTRIYAVRKVTQTR